MGNIRLYAAYGEGLCMHRTGQALASMTKAKEFARRLSLTHPAAEIREFTPQGTERLLDTYVGGKSVAE